MANDEAHEIPFGAKRSDRGLWYLSTIHDIAGGAVYVYDSSDAETPAVWVRIESATGPITYAHLSLEQASSLARGLNWLVENRHE